METAEYLLKKFSYIKDNSSYPEDFTIQDYIPDKTGTAVPGDVINADLLLEEKQAKEEVFRKLLKERIQAALKEDSIYKKNSIANRKLSKTIDRVIYKLERQILSSDIRSSYIETIYEDFSTRDKLIAELSDPYTYANGISLSGVIEESIPAKKSYTVFGGNVSLISGSIKTATENEPFEVFLNSCDSNTYLEIVLKLNGERIVKELYLETDDSPYEVRVYDRLANLLGTQLMFNSNICIPLASATTDTVYVRIKKQSASPVQHFSIKAVELRNKNYQTNGTFVWGPYEIDQASTIEINVCSTIPPNTSIQTFCSIDGGTSYFSFQNAVPFTTATGTSTLTTETVNTNLLKELLDFENEIEIDSYYLNAAIPISETIHPGKLIVKKNLRQDGLVIGGVPSGWYQNGLLEYCTNIIYGQTTTIDFGTSQIYINGMLLSGVQILLPGTYEIKVPAEYFGTVEESLANENALRRRDSLYPYNCRYLIEGYSYPITFKGQQLYPEKQNIWAKTLNYQPGVLNYDEEFKVVEDSTHYYLMIRTSYPDGWQTERYSILYKGNESGAENLYVKLVLSTNSRTVSPIAHYLTIEAL